MTTKPELLDIDPSTLIIGTNIRRRPKTDDLVVSLKANGMLQPILAERTDDGVTVIDGQRRTLAAIDAGLKTVPVLVTAKHDDKLRLAAQFVSNEHRQALDDADRVDAVRELALFGMSAAQIQKRTGLTKETVSAATSVPATTTAAAREVGGTFDLDTLTALSALEGEPEQQAALEELKDLPDDADEHDREWIVKNAARLVAVRKARDTGTAEFVSAHPDVQLIDKAPNYDATDYVVGHRVLRADGTAFTWQDTETIESMVAAFGPALRVYLQVSGGYGDSAYRVSPTGYVAVSDLEAAGLRMKTNDVAVPRTEDEKEADKVAARAERAAVKAWKETADRRRTYLSVICTRKAVPDGWEQFVLAYVFSTPTTNYWSPTKAQAVAMILGLDQLQIDTGSSLHSRDLILAEIQGKQPHRATHAMLAAALAEIEEGSAAVSADNYGAFKPFESHGHLDPKTPAYLDQLEKWGYDATDERALIPMAEA